MTTPLQRSETRNQRHERKLKTAVRLPVSVATINFRSDPNVAFVLRACAAFGSYQMHLIGSMPNRHIMNALSGSTYDYVDVIQYSSPEAFMEIARKRNAKVVAFELPSDNFPAISIEEYEFDFSQENIIVVGNETLGVPPSILQHADRVFIPLGGIGFSLNTSQAANIALYIASQQFKTYKQKDSK